MVIIWVGQSLCRDFSIVSVPLCGLFLHRVTWRSSNDSTVGNFYVNCHDIHSLTVAVPSLL